jgi:hypothetical protein
MAKANDIQKKAGQEIAEYKYMLFWFLCWIDFFKVYLWVGNIGPKNKKGLTSCDESSPLGPAEVCGELATFPQKSAGRSNQRLDKFPAFLPFNRIFSPKGRASILKLLRVLQVPRYFVFRVFTSPLIVTF